MTCVAGQVRFAARLLMSLLIGLYVLSGSGCKRYGIESEYGKRVGDSAGRSVNGTGVLARVFENSGARVRTTTRLARKVNSSDVVVWAPDRYSSPSEEVREFLEDWLNDEGGRTLIYIGRDFDAGAHYWRQAVDASPAKDQLENRRQLARHRAEVASERNGFSIEDDCDWFTIDRSASPRRVTSLEGPWSRGIDASKANLVLGARIKQSASIDEDAEDGFGYHGKPEFTPLLSSDDDVLVAEYHCKNWGRSRIIVVANGSWLLNLPLLNHEHRKLAARLVSECHDADKVVFVESGPREPSLSDGGPNRHHGLQAFTVWPVNCILIHLCILGTILCFSVFPIFGRPHELLDNENSDFGKHIDALGQLMHRTADREYAKNRRSYYLQRIGNDARSQPTSAAPIPVESTSLDPITPESSSVAEPGKPPQTVTPPESDTPSSK